MASTSDFFHVSLSENDVPGAKLAYCFIEKHSNTQLRRWLQCRELKTAGNKQDLVERVKQCMESGNGKHIPVSVDHGKWYDIKLGELKQQSTQVPKAAVAPITGWNNFPSVALPKHFNQGHIHHHVVESVQFVGQNDCDDESDPDIEDLHTSKPLNKGLVYFNSGHVLDMKDCCKDGNYFLKATVMASYTMNTEYCVMVQLSHASGFVNDASCDCPASSMGRCSHITGLLYALEDYIRKYGSDPLSCTSKKCEWNTGRKRKRNPQNVSEACYPSSKKKKVDDIITYDPTPSFPSRNQTDTLNDFLEKVENNGGKMSMWETLLFRKFEDYELDDDQSNSLKDTIHTFTESLSVVGDQCEKVSIQGTEEWHSERRVRITASDSKTIANAKSEKAVYNILRNKLWVTRIQTKAMQYGIENEDNAFEDYARCMSADGYTVKKSGFWVNAQFPEIGASPDGLVQDPKENPVDGLLEIKCPSVLVNTLVQDYETVLSKAQLKSFCIHKIHGNHALKENHAYYYQIQTQLGVLNRQWCDLVIWAGEDNFLVVRVRFDLDFWSNLKNKLVSFHRHWLVPEYLEMRVPRRLMPKKVE